MPRTTLLKQLTESPESFTPEQTAQVANHILSENISQTQQAAFLIALKMTSLQSNPKHVSSFSKSLKEHSIKTIDLKSYPIVDIVGTGGDGFDTFNVSTAAGIVAAGSGCYVAKHGNRSASSKCGSADIIEASGCNLLQDSLKVIDQSNFCFLFAPYYHRKYSFNVALLKRVSAVRKELGVRTIFNIMGPLINPASPNRMIVGVYSPDIGEFMCKSLLLSGVDRALVVCGEGDLDEISPSGFTDCWEGTSAEIIHKRITPIDFGFEPFPISLCAGGDPTCNAEILSRLLDDKLEEENHILKFVLMNAAALIYISGKCDSFKSGVEMARSSIRNKLAKKSFEGYKEYSNRD